MDMLDLAQVRVCASLARAEQYALVLTAMGIRPYLVDEHGAARLFVAVADAPEALRQLDAYDEEEARRARPRPRLLAAKPEGALLYSAVLAFFYAAERSGALGIDWRGAGRAIAGGILGGEWWRGVTALTLHADAGHLFGNLGMGIIAGLLLAQMLGSGVGWLAILLAGALGNGLNALIQPAAHAAIGASTAVFGGIGLLAGVSQVSHAAPWHRGVRRWTPAAAGLALLVMMGTAGENTDVWAHVMGFVAGAVMGLGLGRVDAAKLGRPAVQAACGVAAVGLLAAAWLAAIR
jgi:rhomboid protease GluP